MAAEYTESYQLPSRGILYEDIPEEVTIRNMTTSEEKTLLGSGNAIDRVMEKCMVEPNDLDLGELIVPDKHFLLLKLRILSYGSDYHVTYTCQNRTCGEKHEYKIDLDDLDIMYLDDDFVEPFEIILPMSGDTLELRILRDKDVKKIDKRAKKIKRKTKGRAGRMDYIYRMARYIVSVNGEDKTTDEAKGYVEKLHARDSAYIKDRMGKVEVGYDTKIYRDCPYCGSEVEFELPITEEFFRPRFDD